ncbi:endonuclease VII domain-containing protein [Streptomyces sp. NPDC056192]|uniref:endonuclease VII domain-containing protein n=1 Tax=Streptomyces sp. NPDC056192 TaxID=3345743 RepID=UPI0035D5AA9D
MQEALTPELDRQCGNPECDVDLSTIQAVGTKVKCCSDACKKHMYKVNRKRRHSEMASRWCYACQTEKSIDQYTKPWAPYCQSCTSTKNKERYVRLGGTDAAYAASLLFRYNMTMEEYTRRLEEQEGRCAVCRDKPTKRRLHVDHDHDTGVIRNLLCEYCNHAIGKAKEDPARLRALADYLEEHQQRVIQPDTPRARTGLK